MTSFGPEECDQGIIPSLYVKITAYYNWIVNHTSDAIYCNNPSWSFKSIIEARNLGGNTQNNTEEEEKEEEEEEKEEEEEEEEKEKQEGEGEERRENVNDYTETPIFPTIILIKSIASNIKLSNLLYHILLVLTI